MTLVDVRPSQTATDGRTSKGTFAVGNKLGRGNPLSLKIHRLRNAVLKSVDAGDIRAVLLKLIQQAKKGDVAAARLALEYVLGKPTQPVTVAPIDSHTIHVADILSNAEAAEALDELSGRLLLESQPGGGGADVESGEVDETAAPESAEHETP